jgi:ferredoxin
VIRLSFVQPDGSLVQATGSEGDRLLDAARAAGQPLEGTCGGDMACGTCHVRVQEGLDRLPCPSAEEEDLLDLLPDAGRTSRLACQIRLTAALDGLKLRCMS